MYEHSSQALLHRRAFVRRAVGHVALAVGVVAAAVGAGMLGYHLFAGFGWVDAFVNAAMILGGMGPVDHLDSDGAKIFAGLYALFSGLLFIAVMAVVLGPWVHRMMHRFHLEKSKR